MASERNNFYLRGTVKAVTSETTSNGKAFTRVVVATDGYEDREFGGFEAVDIPLDVFGRGAETATGFTPGTEVEARGFLSSRMKPQGLFGGFQVTAVRAVPGQAVRVQPAPPAPAPVVAADDIPF